MDYYDYNNLYVKAVKGRRNEDMANLAEWFNIYGTDFWNGESWELESGERLYPLYDYHTYGEEIVVYGYEIR